MSVYFIQSGDGGPIKIGATKYLSAREMALDHRPLPAGAADALPPTGASATSSRVSA